MRSDITRAQIQPTMVQPSSRLIQKTDQWRTSRTAAIAHGSMYPAVRIATTMATTLVTVHDRSTFSTRTLLMSQA